MSAEQQNTLLAMLHQIAATKKPKQPPRKFNPRPPGVTQGDSATVAVLAFLELSPGLKTEAQIVWATKRTHSAVSWALLRLRKWGKIDAVPDPSRSSRYYRYRAKVQP
jgi:DNA-binding transcriptional ArsR family regulator